MNWGSVGLSTGIFIVGCGLAYSFYVSKALDATAWAKKWEQAYDVLSHKYYIDELYQAIVDRVVMGWAWLSNMVDRLVVDGLVNGVALGAVAGGDGLKLFQTGRVQSHRPVAAASPLGTVCHLTGS